jgi:lysozyme
MRIITTGSKGIELIKSFEGFSSKPYADPATGARPYTIGYGTTVYPSGKRVELTDKSIDELTAVIYLTHDLKQFELGVDALTVDTINQHQFDALVSFAYNCGLQNLKISTLLKKININAADPSITTEFLKWNKGAGKVMAGLTRRRKAEADLYHI